mmetsp:Transcript_13577/g.47311  ORF Transcript_13577/g.47311 Transcript_13577/m.47311 type:complete len:381 (-) Transcript_13577:1416-2558(-)
MMPMPGSAVTSTSDSGASSTPGWDAACCVMATAIGWSDPASALPSIRQKCGSEMAGAPSSSCSAVSSVCAATAMRPSVSVPVLSNTMAVVRCTASSTAPPLMRMPARAPRPVPTMTAVGVARPSAHGQAMTRVATLRRIANSHLSVPDGNHSGSMVSVLAAISHAINVTSEMLTTAGVNTAETLSTKTCTGAFVVCASETSATICCNALSLPTRVARTRRRPCPLTVPPSTSLPMTFLEGKDSPVIILSSTADSPRSTTPSTATTAPATTFTRSPACTRFASTSRSSPSAMRMAVLGRRSMRARSAEDVLPFATDSRYLPRTTKAMRAADVSKKLSASNSGFPALMRIAAALAKYAADVPAATRKSMPSTPTRAERYAAS